MGYFPNGTEGMLYQERYCDRCVHCSEEHGCPVMLAHELWNYEECNNAQSVLHRMIPRTDDDLDNGQCFAFQPKKTTSENGDQP